MKYKHITLISLWFVVMAFSFARQAYKKVDLPYYDVDVMNEGQFKGFITDQQRLASLGVVPLSRGTRDAGEVLNRWISLRGGTDTENMPDKTAWWTNDTIITALNCIPTVPRFIHCMDQVPGGDLSFMASLSAYDTWDVSSSGSWKRFIDAHPHESLWSTAIPDFFPLQVLAKLRIIHGLKTGDILPALIEVRQLARLMWSTESLFGAMESLAILRIERFGYEEAVARNQIAINAWTPLTDTDDTVFHHVLITMVRLYRGQDPSGILMRLQTTIQNPVGLCPFGMEEANNSLALHALLAEMTRNVY